MHPRDIVIEDFTYILPENRIAWRPLEKRDESKLLIYREGSITEDKYAHISRHLPGNSLLVFNNTRVVEARIIFRKATGGLIEIFCLEPHSRYKDITSAMLQKGKVWWNCLVGGAGKWKHGNMLEKSISIPAGALMLKAGIVERQTDSFTIEFNWQPGSISFAEVLHHAGLIPLPPYIKRKAEEADKERYQTIYAENEGSVAAPTAGLHFTENIFRSLHDKHIATGFVTLHVGAGTFKPVKASRMEDHLMHTEFIDVSQALIEQLLEHTGNTFCVGTTSMRALESIYWMGVKILQYPQLEADQLSIAQWEAYDSLPQDISVTTALKALLQWMKTKQLQRLVSQTQILIAPGYRTRVISGLITNFHQPQSTLLLLVAALIGSDWKKVYAYALENNFRFLSYGDGCLLFK
ncbi:MAG: S-adenosylmethionine:tRNA ribosyltransferase-isomerase [Chitinophagaceae bacterium]|nr:S-adenosylmethionine:tRNA ribosyltransferase-isomerase [Chitinophagaceae bacterium]